jgi:hypothetical protein
MSFAMPYLSRPVRLASLAWLCLLAGWALGESQSCAPGASESASVVGVGFLVVGFFLAVATIVAGRTSTGGATTELVRLAAVFWFVAACYVFLQIAFHCGFMLL